MLCAENFTSLTYIVTYDLPEKVLFTLGHAENWLCNLFLKTLKGKTNYNLVDHKVLLSITVKFLAFALFLKKVIQKQQVIYLAWKFEFFFNESLLWILKLRLLKYTQVTAENVNKIGEPLNEATASMVRFI